MLLEERTKDYSACCPFFILKNGQQGHWCPWRVNPFIERSSLTAWTTGVSNPFWSPRSRTSTSGMSQRTAFAFGVPPDINKFYLYTRNSILLFHPLVLVNQNPVSKLSFDFLILNFLNRLRALYAQSFRITLAPLVLPRLLARDWPGLFS